MTWKKKISVQQTIFTRTGSESTCYVKACYAVAMILAKKSKPYSDGEMIKENYLHVATSVEINLDALSSAKQSQTSHF